MRAGFIHAIQGDSKLKRILLALAVLCLALGLSITGYAVDSKAARSALEKAESFSKKGDLQAARIEYMNAVKEDPNWTKAHILQAQNYIALGDGIGAQASLRAAMESGAGADDIRHLMAVAYHLQGNSQRALEWLQNGEVRSENLADASRTLARIHLSLGNMQDAAAAFNQAIELEPDNSDLWTDIARFRFVGGEQGGAVEAADHALKIDPNNVRAIQFRGELIRNQYGLVTALPWFERALKIAPDDVEVMTEYAATLGDMGRMRDMLSVVRKIHKVDPKNARIYQMQAVLAARAGKYKLAKKLIQKADLDGQERAVTYLLGGVIDFQTGNYNSAIDQFERLSTLQPHNIRARQLLARAMYANGEYEALAEQYGPIADRPNTGTYLLTLVGRSHEALGNREEAAKYLNRATSPLLPPIAAYDEAGPLDTLAVAYRNNPGDAANAISYIRKLVDAGRISQALEIAKAVQKRNPTITEARILLGDVYIAAQKPDKAYAQYALAADARFSEKVMRRMAMALNAQGKGREAGEVIARYMTYNPANTAALRMLAADKIAAANWQAAVRLLGFSSATLGRNDSMLMSELAFSQIKSGDLDDALNNAKIAYFVQPMNPVPTHVYGLALLEQGDDIDSAIELMEKARKITPDNGYLGYNLSRAYVAADRKKDAVRVLKAIMKLGPFPDRDKAVILLNKLSV